MRADLGPVIANLGFLAVGVAILLATRLVRWSPREVLAALGLGYLAGVAAVILALIALTCAGVPFTLQTIAGTMVLLTAAGLAVGWRRRRTGGRETAAPAARLDRWLVGVFLALFAVFVIVGALRASRQPLSDWDAWAIWTPKAIGLVQSDELVLGTFASPAYTFRHPDYPILLPVFEAVHFRAMGGVDTQAIHTQLWLLLAAAGAVVLGSRLPERRTPLALALAGFVAAQLPWQIWTAAHGIEGDLTLSKALDPGFLIDRSGRVWPAIEALELQLADQGRWTLIVPAGLALAVLGFVLRRGRGLATFYLASGLLVFASLVWAYWISPYELQWHLRTSVGRVVTVVVVIAMTAALHLPALLSRRVRPGRSEPA